MNIYKLLIAVITLLLCAPAAYCSSLLINRPVEEILAHHQHDNVKQLDEFISVDCVVEKMPCQITYQLDGEISENTTYVFLLPPKTLFSDGLKAVKQLMDGFIKAKSSEVQRLKIDGIAFTKILGEPEEHSRDYLFCQGRYDGKYNYDIKLAGNAIEKGSPSYVTSLSIRIYKPAKPPSARAATANEAE